MDINKFVENECYNYDDLSEVTQSDIDVQFMMYDSELEDEDESNKYKGHPDDYSYCFMYLKPDLIKTVFPHVNDIIHSKTGYLNKIFKEIQDEGLQYPAVGTEGNHRATVYFLLQKELPYLKIVRNKR